MPKLHILSGVLEGKVYDLVDERVTVGRAMDNMIRLEDGTVSHHHAMFVLDATDYKLRDLNSTNGTFINNEKITETVLKPGQTLRFGQVELRIDDGKPVTAPPPPAPVGAPAPAPMAPKKATVEGTMIIPRGVSLTDLEQGGSRPPGFDTKNTGFSKKTNKVNTYFIIGGIIVGVIIVGLILFALSQTKGH